jgi:hypothetical protein
VTIYDLLWKKGESKEGKAQWERVGVLIEKGDGKKSVKLDLVPAGNTWDGWLVVSERKEKGDF